DAEQPCRGGNPDGQGDDGRRGETGASAEDTQRVSEISGEGVHQEVSSATSAKEHDYSGSTSNALRRDGADWREQRRRHSGVQPRVGRGQPRPRRATGMTQDTEQTGDTKETSAVLRRTSILFDRADPFEYKRGRPVSTSV